MIGVKCSKPDGLVTSWHCRSRVPAADFATKAVAGQVLAYDDGNPIVEADKQTAAPLFVKHPHERDILRKVSLYLIFSLFDNER